VKRLLSTTSVMIVFCQLLLNLFYDQDL